ncbi:MAG TPA: Crp/Fnr family transcriptional regulator [Chloroflexota bacterium]|jgi:CRP-like cAMP-binding protein
MAYAVPAQMARSPVFSALPAPALDQLAAAMQRRLYKRGQVVFHQDDSGASVHVIESGRIKVVLATQEGEELLLRVLGAGELFGELALLDGRPRSATVVALEDTVTHVLERSAFLEFLRTHPEAALDLCRALAELIRRLTEQVEDLALLDVPRRLEHKLLELAETYGEPTPRGIRIDVRLTQSELASMIGTSRASVNHYLASLEARGIIQRDGQRIVLRRPEALHPHE